MSPRPESERSDWTDLDLLTREEATERLQEEIAEIEPRITDAEPAERELLESRLRALREAVDELAAQ
jgi:prefoldin subunit 5